VPRRRAAGRGCGKQAAGTQGADERPARDGVGHVVAVVSAAREWIRADPEYAVRRGKVEAMAGGPRRAFLLT